MLYHARQLVPGIDGTRGSTRAPWQAFSGGSPRQLGASGDGLAGRHASRRLAPSVAGDWRPGHPLPSCNDTSRGRGSIPGASPAPLRVASERSSAGDRSPRSGDIAVGRGEGIGVVTSRVRSSRAALSTGSAAGWRATGRQGCFACVAQSEEQIRRKPGSRRFESARTRKERRGSEKRRSLARVVTPWTNPRRVEGEPVQAPTKVAMLLFLAPGEQKRRYRGQCRLARERLLVLRGR